MPASTPGQYLDAARGYYDDAARALVAAKDGGGTSGEAMVLLAFAQAAATLSIAGALADGVRLHMDTESVMEDFEENLGSFTAAIRRLLGRLDDDG